MLWHNPPWPSSDVLWHNPPWPSSDVLWHNPPWPSSDVLWHNPPWPSSDVVSTRAASVLVVAIGDEVSQGHGTAVEHGVKVRSGSLLRNSGHRVSWRMVPTDTTPDTAPGAMEDSPHASTNISTNFSDSIPESREVVLREVEGVDKVNGIFQSTITVLQRRSQVAVT